MTTARWRVTWWLVWVVAVGGCAPRTWVGSWAASPQDTDEPLPVSGATVRYSVRLSVGGERLRLVVSNAHGQTPLRVGAVHVAWAGPHGREDRVARFHGQGEVTVAPGGLEQSDPVSLAVPDLAQLQLSAFFPGDTVLATEHSLSLGATQLSGPGDFTASEVFPVKQVVDALGPVLQVQVEARAGAVVVLGDSVVDGVGSTPGLQRRWPDAFAERALASGRRCAVLNQGVGGARLLHDFVGLSGLRRFDRDVVAQPGVRAVIVELGLNDLGIPGAFEDFRGEVVTPEQLVAGYQQLVARAHAAHLRIYAATLGPFEGARRPGYFSAEGEAKRTQVNQWLRSAGAFDGVLDLDAVLRDPAHPTQLRPDFDSGDHLHPNDVGYRAIAEAVDPRWCDGP